MKPYEGMPVYGDLNDRIGVGFGTAMLMRDGQPVWQEQGQDWDDLMTFGEALELAKKQPKCVWEIHLIGPLTEAYYRLTGGSRRKRWKLFATGRGFA